MSERRRGLGRGLGALIPSAPIPESVEATIAPGTASPTAVPILPQDRGVAAGKIVSHVPVPELVDERPDHVSRETEDGPAPVDGAHFAELSLDSITPNPRQPREVFDEEALLELIQSIKEVGLLQPVVVRQTGPERYELIMGERRWRACREAGLERVPAIVRATEDERLLLDALLENLHRAQLNPLEEAAAYDQLLRDFSCTHDELADRIGRSRPHVSNTLRLLKLPPPVQAKVAAGTISAGHARALVRVRDPEQQEKLAVRTIAEGLSVRSLEEIVQLMEADGERKTRRTKSPRAGRLVSPALADLGARLSDRFETRVKVDLGQKKGKIVVEFASVEDLERILSTMAPGEDQLFQQKLADTREPAAD